MCSRARLELLIILASVNIAQCASDQVLSCLRQERSKHENPVQNVVTVMAQEPAYLHCRIPEGTSHMVAWTRSSDQALLTAGEHSFTSDPRFQVSKKSDSDWILILRRADLGDTGCYLCEVNTEPLSTIYAIYLDVQKPPTAAVPNRQRGTRLMANMAGDEVLLNCTVAVGNEPADDDVIWTRDGKEMNLNDTNKYIWKVKRSAGVIVHTVRIREATMEDDGNYACESRHQRASQIVHVNKAEAQRSCSTPLLTLLSSLALVMAAQKIL
ncbi:unnamed protein product [Cylicocyclus nassatus]|uniref:Ig-like domain-containing protein n=1 Tax=Cylicocyclus nassatus TaxID=53992 RepID=A0AA36GUJ8_CYLNA|nr:unnamed protein product [Cylicocyclus nassatus]